MVDHQRQLDTATAFFLAGERCALELRFYQYGFHTVSAPTIVNYALAVEIALKLLHSLVTGETKSGHDLGALYEQLPGGVRANLLHLAEENSVISRHFVDWRYPYEKDLLIGDFENSRRAFIECYREIRRVAPALVSVYEELWGTFEPDWIQAWSGEQPKYELNLVAV